MTTDIRICAYTGRACEPGCKREGICLTAQNKIANQQQFLADSRIRATLDAKCRPRRAARPAGAP